MRNNTLFLNRLKELDISLTNLQIEQFEQYFDLLIEWNEKINLTAITEYNDVLTKHFLDSALITKIYSISDVRRMLDLGTGAGFPGIPLKILYPQIEVVLLDSLNKRILFLNEVIEGLGLQGIIAIHGRAEELGRNMDYRESFDLCVSRAVAKLSSLCEFCLPFVKVGGSFIPYKSAKIKDEIKEAERAIQILGGKMISQKEIFLPETDISRSFPLIQKVKETPKQYPRAGGKPLKAPL